MSTLLRSVIGKTELKSPPPMSVARAAIHGCLLLSESNVTSMTVFTLSMPAWHTAATISLLTAALEEPLVAFTCKQTATTSRHLAWRQRSHHVRKNMRGQGQSQRRLASTSLAQAMNAARRVALL
jgi:hypothetical protein